MTKARVPIHINDLTFARYVAASTEVVVGHHEVGVPE